MPANPAMLDYLLARRSVGMAFLKEPGPSAAQLQQLLTIGTRVPDHGKLTPWRLVLIERAPRRGNALPRSRRAGTPNTMRRRSMSNGIGSCRRPSPSG